MSGFVLDPHEGPAYEFHGATVVIKASGEHTLGQLGVMESAYPPGLVGPGTYMPERARCSTCSRGSSPASARTTAGLRRQGALSSCPAIADTASRSPPPGRLPRWRSLAHRNSTGRWRQRERQPPGRRPLSTCRRPTINAADEGVRLRSLVLSVQASD